MNEVTVSLEAVYIYIVSSLINKISIFTYALLNIHARDG